jgi:hypothetical protein
VGASYLVPPNKVKAALMEALRRSSRVLPAPAPDVLLVAFGDSAINYRVRFWIDDYSADEVSRDEVRTAIYYVFQRHEIEIPWPIQVQYERQEVAPDAPARIAEGERLLAGVDIFATLPPELLHQVALAAPMAVYGNGETIVRQGEPGQSMFILLSGTVSVVLEPMTSGAGRTGHEHAQAASVSAAKPGNRRRCMMNMGRETTVEILNGAPGTRRVRVSWGRGPTARRDP